jgi:hypothetical protein
MWHKNKLRLLVGKPEIDKLIDLGVDGTLILKRILQKQDKRQWIGFIRLRLGASCT